MKDAPNLCTKIVTLYHNYPLLEKKKIILLAYMHYTLTYPIYSVAIKSEITLVSRI